MENGDVKYWLIFLNVHSYAIMGTLRRSDTIARTEETDAARMRCFTNHGSFDVSRVETTLGCSEPNLVPRCKRNEKRFSRNYNTVEVFLEDAENV